MTAGRIAATLESMRGAVIGGMLAALLAVGCEDFNSNEPIEPTPIEPFERLPEPIPFGGEEWRASEPPLPVTGGHLAVIDDTTVAAADPDGRELFIVRGPSWSVQSRHALAGEPGRVVADSAGSVHVVLRDAAAIVSVDVATDRTETRAVCASPRGLGYDAETDALFVACLDGRVQRLPRVGGAVETIATLDEGDLRDVVPQPEGLWVTHFRSARISLLHRDGTLAREVTIPLAGDERELLIPSIAWRAVARPGGGIVVSHQRHTSRTVSTTPMEDPFTGQPASAYGGGFDPTTGECHPPLVTSAVAWIDATGTVDRTGVVDAPLPVDLATTEYGAEVASAALTSTMQSVRTTPIEAPGMELGCRGDVGTGDFVDGQAISVAVIDTTAIVQTRFPSGLWINWERVPFGDRSHQDIGNALFHADTTSRLACASCHPEGGEDGIRWSFFGVGARRTQELRGGLLATAPFHWAGDQPTLQHIMDDTFSGRMGGGEPTQAQMDAVGHWLDATPLPVLEQADAADEGRAVFEREGCADCHAGAQLTNNGFADFGRGNLQVPSLLGVSYRGPWMHDGCARTLEGTVLASCAGEGHTIGTTDEHELGALFTYLRSL